MSVTARCLGLAGLVCITYPSQVFADIPSLSLDVLVQQSIMSHPLVLSANAEFDATRIEAETARLQWAPTPSIQSSMVDGDVISRFRIDQPIWTNGRITASIQQARLIAQTANANIELQRYIVASEVIDAWSLLLQSEEKIRIADLNHAQLSHYEEMMQRRVTAEISARIELDLIASRVLQSQVSRSEAVAASRLAVVRLQELTRLSIQEVTLDQLPSLRQLTEQIVQHFDEHLIEQLRSLADQHPVVRRAQYQAAEAEKTSQIKHAEQFPSIFLSYTKNLSSQKTIEDSEDGYFALELQYTPNAGFSSWGLSKAASARVQSLEQSKTAARSEIYMQMQTNLQNYLSASERIKSLQAAAKGAEAVRESYERQFIVGRKSWLDVMNAAREVEQNAYQLADAQTNLLVAYYHLKLQSGQMLRQSQDAE